MNRVIKIYQHLDRLPKGTASDRITKGCLVVEGGAFRGLYNQGVLDALMLQDLNFEAVIGVSAGALAGMNYVSGQIGRSARANLTYRHDPNYIGLRAMRKCHSVLRLDFLLKDYNQIEALNAPRFYSNLQRFVAVATNCDTGKTEFFEKGKCADIMSAIKASASMPYVSPMVSVDGIPCLDGGCSCKIPVQWALDQGYEKIVVIRTREHGFRKGGEDSDTAQKIYRRHPEFARVLDHSDSDYDRECALVEQLEDEGRIFVFAPSKPVRVKRIEPSLEKLGELYWEGYDETIARLPELRAYLEKM